MSVRIVFWPYDHRFLREFAGSGDSSLLAAIDTHTSKGIKYDPESQDAWNLARKLAQDTVTNGFPTTGQFREDQAHRNAVEMLVYLCKHECSFPDHEFRYLDFLDSVSEILEPLPTLSDALHNGRPWFGNRCGQELEYGTIEPSECKTIADRCSSLRSKLNSSDVDPIHEIFQYAVEKKCQLWFRI